MQKFLLFSIASMMFLSSFAQNDTIPSESKLSRKNLKQKEIGVQFDDLDNFGVTFKFGSRESLWRVHTMLISGRHEERRAVDSLNETTETSQYGLKLGREYRKTITNVLEFVYGLDISFHYNYRKDDKNDKTNNLYRVEKDISYEPGINLVLGINYWFTDHLSIGIEILPRFTYNYGTSKHVYYDDSEVIRDVKYENSGFNYGLNNRYGLVTVSLRF